ncbi:MAG: hypothetical protein RLZ77_505 [Bacteroidota bacterium]|jgi:gliding motility-associated-like protein
MKKIILLLFVFLFCFTFSSAQTFSNSISEAAGSWNGTLTKTVNVSGISNLNSGIFELVQVNLSMGDNANTRNYNTYRITLTKGTATIDLVAVGGLPNSTIKQINTKFRFNPYLRRLFEHGGTAEPFSIGYYRSQDDFTAFNGIDPNGTWTITITETSFATGGRFNNVDLVFKTPYTVQDYTTLNSYDNCATPYCLGTAEIIVASNNGFTNQTSDMYNPNTTGCSWNAAQNNSAWFKFRAAQANASITISGITNNIQILGIDAGPDDNPCTNNDNTVLNGGCPTLVTNDTYATPQYTNGSTKNNQLNLSGLTPGKYYYFIVDGTSSAVSPFYIETLGASLDCSNCNLNPTVTSNSPVCENSTLNLTCSEGVSWEWSGPNGFSSTEQNPIIPNVSLLANGTYTVTITDANNCTETRTVDVQISAIVTPLFNASSPVCSGTTINALPTTSNNGIEGTWSPALNNTATTTYTFAPNTGQCATNATITIQINDCDFGAYASAVWMDDCFTPGDGKFYNTTGSGVDLINQEPGNTFAQNFGVHIQNSSTLIMRGSEVKTYKNGNTNVCGATLYYRYYLNSATGGSFTGRNLGFFSDCNTGTNEFSVGGGPCVAGQQKWQCVSQPSCDSPINLTNVPPGDYTLEVYYEISGDFNSTSQCDDTILLNNGGTNYKAFFSIIPLPQVTGSNPTICNVPNGSITLAGLTLNETYTIQYTFGTTTVGPINYLSNEEGSIVIPNLGIGTYSNFSIEINNCTTVLPDVVTLQNPISTPLFSTPNPICNGASIDATVFPTVSNNGISGVWSPEFTNTVTTVYTFTPLANQCANTTTLTLVVNPAITANTNTSPNTVCNGSSSLCVPSGDHVVINEVMHFPTTAQGLVANGTEYIELYNPTCDPVDLSCYTLATAAKPNANPGSVLSRGGTIILPFGTTILPKSHFVIGTSTSAVNLSDIDFNTTVNSTYCAINQFVLANGDGWVGLYNANGNPVDAIYWTVNTNESQKISTDDDLDDAPCIPNSIPSCSTTGLNLLSAKEIYLLDPTLISYVGQTTILGLGSTGNTFSRMPDGGLWQRNIPGSIILNCNSGICDTPTSTSCNGTATVTITQGSGNYSYLWNDPLGQTTSTAINLCAGNYCVSVTDLDTNCTQEFCVTVNDDIPLVNPTFDFGNNLSICAGTAVPNLPATSANGIQGTWNPTAINNTSNGTYTFTPDANQCASAFTYSVNITPEVIPTFNFGTSLTVCEGVSAQVLLPSLSNNSISGTWNPSTIDASILGETIYTFTPDAGQCATTTTFTVTVNPQTTTTFSFGNNLSLCAGAAVPNLPATSANGIQGTWNPAIVDNTANGTYTFTPDANQCATAFTYSVSVTPVVIPTFGFGNNLSLCAGAAVPNLPATSANGIQGTWSPSVVDNTANGTYTFTPEANQCATTTTFTATVTPQTTPTFSFGNNLSICAGAAVPNLITTSANGIQGTWSPSVVDNTTNGTYTFTPEANQCATAFVYSVSITPGVIPTFGFGNNLSICAGSAVPNLPTTSTNGIQGTWSPSVVDNTANGTYVFTPNSSGSSGPNLIVNGDFSQGNSSFSTDYQFITNAGQSGVQRAYGIVTSANSWFQFFQPCVSNAPSGGNMMVVDGSTSNAGNDKVWGQTVAVLPNKTYTFSYWLQTIATPNQALIEIKINGTTLGTALAPNTNCQTTQYTYQWNSGSNTTAQIEIFDRIFAANGNDFSLDDISLVDNSPQCTTATTLTVTITPQTIPTFSFGTSLTYCQGGVSLQPLLPTLSNNSISGTWNPSTIDNSLLGQTIYTFTPNAGQCATSATLTVTITPQITPTFSFGNNLTICAGATAPSLPATSTNGIQGTWNPAVVDNTSNGTYTFSPDANQCATAFTYSVSVTPEVIPTFNFGTSLTVCEGVSTQVLLPSLSNNSISGTWDPSTIDASILGQTIYTFTPDNGQCARNSTFTVTVNPIPQFTISGGCDGNDFVLEIVEENQNINTVEWYYNNNLIGQGNSIVISGEGLYTAVATNALNCDNRAQFDVTNDFCTIPKGVSANNDGDNDNFDLTNLNVERLQIFNRWGMVVYEQKNYTNQWDGRSSDGTELPDGTYFYSIEQRSGKIHTGWVYLIREY